MPHSQSDSVRIIELRRAGTRAAVADVKREVAPATALRTSQKASAHAPEDMCAATASLSPEAAVALLQPHTPTVPKSTEVPDSE